jgi:hypothetical protein
MTGISLAGLLGAIAGTIFAAINYYLLVFALNQGAGEREQTLSREERDKYDRKVSMMLRIFLPVELVTFAAGGYWLGRIYFG